MQPDEFRKIIREEVSEVIQEVVPPMIEEQVSRIVEEKVNASSSHHFGVMKEWFTDKFGILNEKIDLNQEKNDRNFAELREDISHIKTILDEHTIDIAELKEKSESIHHSWRPS